MSHLRIAGGIHQQSWERSPGFPTSQTEPEGLPLVKATIAISAPFSLIPRNLRSKWNSGNWLEWRPITSKTDALRSTLR